MTPSSRKWSILLTMALVNAICSAEQSMVAVAYSSMEKFLPSAESAKVWVLTTFALTVTACIMLGERFTRRLGLRDTLLLGLFMLLLGSVGCAITHESSTLILFRVIQGCGGGLMIPPVQPLLLRMFPDSEQGKAFGVFGALLVLATALSPLVGGIMAEYGTGAEVFWVMAGIAAFAMAGTLILVDETQPTDPNMPFDFRSYFLAAGALFCGLFAVQELPRWGFFAWEPWVFLAIAVGFGYYFWKEHKVAQDPWLDAELMRVPIFKTCLKAACCNQVASASMLLVIFYVGRVLEVAPMQIGLLSLAFTVPVIFAGPIAGGMVDRAGPRKAFMIGFGLCSAAMFAVAALAWTQSLIIVGMAYLPYAVGSAFIYVATASTIMTVTPDNKKAWVSSLLFLVRSMSGVYGLGLALSISSGIEFLARGQGFPEKNAYALGFIVSLSLLAACDLYGFFAMRKELPSVKEEKPRRKVGTIERLLRIIVHERFGQFSPYSLEDKEK